MPYCLKCGTPAIPGARFCKACGTPIWTPSPNIQPPADHPAPRGVGEQPYSGPGGIYDPPAGGGMQDIPGIQNGADNVYDPSRQGAADAPYTFVRCTRCGQIIPEGAASCPACGTPALEKAAYVRLAAAGRQAQDIQRKHGAGALLSIWISLLMLICLIVLMLMLFAHMVDDSLFDFIEDTLPKVLLVAVPLLLLLFLMIWGISRSDALRRAGLTSAQYRSTLKDVGLLPKTFFDGAESLYGPDGTPNKKTMSQGGVIALLSVSLAVVMGITVWVGVSGNDWGNIAFTSSNSSSSSGGQLSGRWEGQVIGYTTDSNGITLQQIDAPAIVFRGDKAYWGSSGVDDDAIIGECEGWGFGITTYKISGGRITFTDVSSGESYSFKFDGTTIYYGEYEIQRVD